MVGWKYVCCVFKNPTAALLWRGDYGFLQTGSVCPPCLRMVTYAVRVQWHTLLGPVGWMIQRASASEEQKERKYFERSVKLSFQL